MVIRIEFEGNANKLGIGIVKNGDVLSNCRRMYISPPGEDFKPRNTAQNYSLNIAPQSREALEVSGIQKEQIDVLCFTKGPGIGSYLTIVANVARTVALLGPGNNIEQMAKRGSNYYQLPYVIKMMNVSCSGILSNIEKKAQLLISSSGYTAENL